MFKRFKQIITLFLCLYYIKSENLDDTTTKSTCRNKNRLIGSNKNDLFDVTEAEINKTVILECHYCFDKTDDQPKIWYKIDYLNKTPREIKLDMHKDEKFNRISISLEHSLQIHHVLPTDVGIYFCHGLNIENVKDIFNYILDITINSIKPTKGNITTWKRYHDDYILPINKRLSKSDEAEFLQIRQNLQTQLEVITDWEVDYGPCQICGRPVGEGIQEKFGFCRIKIETKKGFVNDTLDGKMNYFLSLPKISCRSLLVQELFPFVSDLTKQLNDFVLVKKCNGTCNPDAGGVNQGWKFGSGKNYKYRRTMVLNEGAHLTLICPESSLENTIVWRKNGKVLSQGQAINNENNIDSIHIVVDAFNSLYLIHVTEKEEGNYTCQVDDIRMQQIRIFIKTNSKLLTEEFVRHMKYLAFVLCLSVSCYCAGVIAACKRKHKFKGYREVATLEI